MDDKIIIDACAHLGLTTGETQDPLRVAAYVAALRDLKNEVAFVDAVDILVNATGRFPKIVDFREAYFAALGRQPKHPALSGGTETEAQERDRFEWQAGQAKKLLDMLSVNGGSLVRSMDDTKWPTGPWRKESCITKPFSQICYSDSEFPGGGSPSPRRPSFGDRS